MDITEKMRVVAESLTQPNISRDTAKAAADMIHAAANELDTLYEKLNAYSDRMEQLRILIMDMREVAYGDV